MLQKCSLLDMIDWGAEADVILKVKINRCLLYWFSFIDFVQKDLNVSYLWSVDTYFSLAALINYICIINT